MCVKEFLGYNCGHCSIHLLRQCPLSASNPQFPICDYPAERPLFADEYCHPCSRIVWNARVLEQEAEHKQRHLRKEQCDCGSVFEEEAAARRTAIRMGKRKEVVSERYADLRVGNERNYADPRAGDRSEHGSQTYRTQYKFGTQESTEATRNTNNQCLLRTGLRDEWDIDAKMAVYRYAGYHTADAPTHRQNQQQLFTDSLAPGHREPLSPWATEQYIPHHPVDLRQSAMLQNGACMKWYTKNTLPTAPSDMAGPSKHPRRSHQSGPSPQVGPVHKPSRNPPNTRPSRTQSEPSRKPRFKDYTPKLEEPEIQAQSVVVSSDMFIYDTK